MYDPDDVFSWIVYGDGSYIVATVVVHVASIGGVYPVPAHG
jgi:hypothetical protein